MSDKHSISGKVALFAGGAKNLGGLIARDLASHKTAAAWSAFSPTGLTHIEDVVPFIRHLVSDGWWINGQTVPINGGCTTR